MAPSFTTLPQRLLHALGSLRLRLALAGIVLIALVVSATTALMVHRADQATLAAQRERELAETVRTAALLSRRVLDLQSALRAVAEQLDARTLHDPRALERFLAERTVLRQMFGNVNAVTPEGTVRAYADRTGLRRMPFNVADRDYFREAMAQGHPVISEAMPSRVRPEPVIVLAQPLRDAQGSYGVLSGVLRLGSEGLLEQVLQYRDPDAHGALLVVTDARGRILAHPDRERLLQPLSADPVLAPVWEEWVRVGSPLEAAGVPLEHAGQAAAMAAVDGPQWLVWRTLPAQRLLAPLHDARREALGWAALMVLAASLALLALVGWLLRPLHALQQRARHLFHPDHDPHAGWPRASGEIGELVHALHHASAERAQLERFNTELLQRLEAVMAAAPVGIAFTQRERLELVNAELSRLLGWPPSALAGQTLERLGLDNASQERLLRAVPQAFAEGRPYRGEWQLRRADGSTFWAQVCAQPAHVVQPVPGWIWTVSDISAQVAMRARLQWSANHDRLTGLANRAWLEQQLERVYAQREDQPAALVAIDLDHFKPVNDSAGHAAGDAMLQAVAQAIKSCVRSEDLVARLGGDEFVLLLERCSMEQALQIARTVCAAVARIELCWEDRVLRVGASAGVAALHPEMAEVTHWLRAADRACYEAKAAGRGRACAAPAATAQGCDVA